MLAEPPPLCDALKSMYKCDGTCYTVYEKCPLVAISANPLARKLSLSGRNTKLAQCNLINVKTFFKNYGQ